MVQKVEQLVQSAPEGIGAARPRPKPVRRVAAMLALALLALAVQGCREDEQNRPLVYDKGTYQGPADEELSQDQIEALRRRTAGQRD